MHTQRRGREHTRKWRLPGLAHFRCCACNLPRWTTPPRYTVSRNTASCDLFPASFRTATVRGDKCRRSSCTRTRTVGDSCCQRHTVIRTYSAIVRCVASSLQSRHLDETSLVKCERRSLSFRSPHDSFSCDGNHLHVCSKLDCMTNVVGS